MKKLIAILLVLFAIAITYHLLANTISDYISNSYGTRLNEARLEFGLQTISNNQLKNVTYYGIEDSNDLSLFFGNEKSFVKEWTLNTNKKGYYKNKLIGYAKSYWFWENRIQYEIDKYEKPLSKLENEELMVVFDYEEHEYFARLDTVKSELAETLKTNRIDSIYQFADDNNLIICGTAMMEMEMGDDYLIGEFDTVGLSKNQVETLLNKWKVILK